MLAPETVKMKAYTSITITIKNLIHAVEVTEGVTSVTTCTHYAEIREEIKEVIKFVCTAQNRALTLIIDLLNSGISP